MTPEEKRLDERCMALVDLVAFQDQKINEYKRYLKYIAGRTDCPTEIAYNIRQILKDDVV